MPLAARIAILTAAVVLAAAPSALADTLTVNPADDNNACTRGSDNTCKTIAQAIAQAQDTDTIAILAGTYAESPSFPAGKDDLIVKGAGIGETKITGSGTTDVVRLQGANTILSDLSVDVPTDAGSAISAEGNGIQLARLSAQRQNASAVNDPVIAVPGTATIANALVLQNAGTATAAIASSGAGGTVITDVVAVSLKGPAVTFATSEGNRIVRSSIASGDAASYAVVLTSTAAGLRRLVADSSFLIGGKDAGGLIVQTTGAAAGDVTVALRHVTIAGAAKGITLDASAAQGPGTFGIPPGAGDPSGNIDATVTSSIVHGASSATQYNTTTGGLFTSSNVVKLTYQASDASPASGNGTIDMGSATNTADAALFAPGRLTLRADAPLIDRGSAPAGGESEKDFEGDPRQVDGPDADTVAQSDIGADEFVNKPPKAAFGVINPNRTAKQNQAVGLVSLSTDPEQNAGGGISEYRWDFGDGTKETTRVGGVAHSYPNVGAYNVTLTVVDTYGAVSNTTDPQTITIVDGLAPKAEITIPEPNAKLTLNRKAKKAKKGSKRKPKAPKPLQLNARGTAEDEAGIAKVEVSLRVVSRDRIKGKSRRPLAKGQCEYYSGRLLAKKACNKEIWLVLTLKQGVWKLTTKKNLRLPAGRYELRVRATDTSGNVSPGFTVKDRTLVKFRVK